MLHARDRNRPTDAVEPGGPSCAGDRLPETGRPAGVSVEPVLTAARLAEVLGVSRRWIYSQVEEHEMPVYRTLGGRQLLLELSAVETWLDAYRSGDWSPHLVPIRVRLLEFRARCGSHNLAKRRRRAAPQVVRL